MGAKISVNIAMTLRIRKEDNYEYIRPSFTISDIDVDGNVEEQINKSKEAGRLAWEAVSDVIGEMIRGEIDRVLEEK